jgi:hypothetical protein
LKKCYLESSSLAEEKTMHTGSCTVLQLPHISPPEYPSISYPHPSLSFWMKQGACVAVEMLLPNKERNSVVLAGETRLVTASSPMVLWLTQRPYIVIFVVLA